MYDVSGAQPVNVTSQMLMPHLNALAKEMIVYKAPQEKTCDHRLYRHHLRLLPEAAQRNG